MKIPKLLPQILIFSLFFSYGFTSALEANDSLRGVFRESLNVNNTQQTVGKLSVQLYENGSFRTVNLHQHKFRSGDRFRFQVASSRAGWLYVLHRPPNGEPSLLWPRQKPNTSTQFLDENQIKLQENKSIPAYPGIFRFDQETGQESFYVAINSKQEIPQLTAKNIRPTPTRSTSKPASGNRIVNFRVKSLSDLGNEGFKSVIYDTIEEKEDPAIYFSTVNNNHKGVTLMEFELQHE